MPPPLRNTVADPIFFSAVPGVKSANSGNDEAVAAMMRSPQSIIGSSDAGAHLKTLCGAGDTTSCCHGGYASADSSAWRKRSA